MYRTLSILLTICLLTALLPVAQAEPDDMILVTEDAGESQDFIGEFTGDLFGEEIPAEDAPSTPTEDEASAARYARLLTETPVYEDAGRSTPLCVLPEGSRVLVVDGDRDPMRVAFACGLGATVGYVDADRAALLSGDEAAAMLSELLGGSVLLYENDLDRPLPWAEPLAAPTAESAAPEGSTPAEEAPAEEGPVEQAVEEEAIEVTPAEDDAQSVLPEDGGEADVETPDGEGEGVPALIPEPEEADAEPFDLDAALAAMDSGEETVETVVDSPLSSDEQFAGYVDRILYASASRALRTNATTNAGAQLTGQNLIIYNALKAEILKIAAGSRSSTVIAVPVSTVLGKTTFTASEVTDMLKSGVYSWDINLVAQALWLDCTYELYWFDRYQYNISASWPSNPFVASGSSYTVNGKTIVFNLPVLTEYRLNGNRLAVDTSLIQGAKTAAENAKAIVKKYAGYSDYVKLFGYAVEICDLVDYHSAAAAGELDKSVQDPWKLIWVFDGNKSTNVVCEGYAQAFQYLCELTDFNDGIRCVLVTGYADGQSHSWNIVRMDDGKNYLVDVTWMDSSRYLAGLSGNMADWINEEKGGLFLCGAASGSASGGYNVSYRAGGTTRRTYWDATLKAYTSSTLTLASSKYVLTGLQRIGNSTYYFDNSGHYVTGTQDLDGLYLEFDDQGRLEGTPSGWQTVNGKRYFFESSGLLHTHHTVVTDAAVAATCTAAGKTAGSHCSVCGLVLTVQTVVPAKGHTVVVDKAVAATYTKTGKTEGSHCSVCGTVLTAQKTVAKLNCDFHMTKSATKKVNLGVPIQIIVDGKSVKSYATSNKKIATVTSKGWVTTKKAGTAKITITLKNKKKLTLTVRVVDPYAPTSIKITNGSKATLSLKKNKTLTLKTKLAPTTAKTTLTWSSSNKKVATVSSKGVVTARKKGTAKITVKTANGKKATIKITVKK